MKALLIVFVGSGIGGVLRYLLSKYVSLHYNGPFPLGTLVVNVLGCFFIGVIIGWGDYKQLLSPRAQLFWATGFCGGFSTFSTFSHENVYLFKTGEPGMLLGSVFLSVVLCFGATFLGLYLAQK